jgi:thiamine phosphate synthase YjbQ (UPF0047 family)
MRISTKKAVIANEFVRKSESSLALIYCDINQLKPNPNNPRIHSKEQLHKLQRSMKKFGFVSPVLVDRDGHIVAGHGRVEAAKAIGMKQVPTICLDHLTEAELSVLMIADNRLTELGEWNERLLAEQFKILSELDLDMELEETGFEMGEIDVILEHHSAASTDEEDAADELPDLNPQIEVVQRNDAWLLNRHRIVCGNAVDEHIYSLLMDNRRANAVFTDRLTTTLSTASSPAPIRCVMPNSPWPRVKWVTLNTQNFSTKLFCCWRVTALPGPLTISSWTGVMPNRCLRPPRESFRSSKACASG